MLPTLGVLLYSSTGKDDSYLTYWPAYTLASFGEIVNYNGVRLEQSSSLLHTLVLAAGTWAFRVDLPTLGYVISLAAGMAIVLLVWAIARVLVPSGAWMSALLAATSTSIVYWALSGMETTLDAALLLATVFTAARYVTAHDDRARRRLVPAAVLALAYVMVRPESGAVLLCTLAALALVGLALRSREEWRRVARRTTVLGLIVVVGVVALVGARLLYFGSGFPQPVSAKARGLHVGAGVKYLYSYLKFGNPIGVLVAAFAVWGVVRIVRRPTVLGVLVAGAAVAHLGFVVLVGGDWMEGGRFLLAAQALAAVLAIVGIGELSYRVALVGMLVVLQIGGVVRFAHGQSNGTPVWATPVSPVPTSASVAGTYSWLEHQDRVHLRDTTTVGPLERVVAQLHARLHRPVTIASGQAGMVAYYTFRKDFGRARFIDTNSLASDRFSRCPELLSHTTLGAHITYGAWFTHTAQCHVPLPDVVLDTYDPAGDPALKEHYALAYAQRGPITTSSSLLPGYRIRADQFISVRHDLAPYVTHPA
jgi:hypothetical protein